MRAEVNKVRLTVLIALLFSMLCAGVFRTTPIIFMAALLCSAPIIGFLVGAFASRSLRLTRHLPESGMVGDVIHCEITVTNESRWPQFLVHVHGEVTAVKTRHQRRKASKSTPTPSVLVPMASNEWVAPILRPHQRTTWKQQWILQRRGVHEVGPARAGVLDPLGLYNRLPAATSPHQMVVLPRPVRIDQLGFLGGEDTTARTLHHAATVANATNFHGVRPWQPGEAVRRAHWKSTARTGQLHVIEWEETPTADLAIFLDTHAESIEGDDLDNTLEATITATASVACHLLEHGCRVQLFFYAPGKADQPQLQMFQAQSVHGTNAVLRALAEITAVPGESATLSHLVDEALPSVARGLGVLLLASNRAEIATGLMRTQSRIVGAHCHALAFENGRQRKEEEASFETGIPSSRAVEAALPSARARQHTAVRSGARTKQQAIQIIQTHDSLAAALERSS